MKLQLGTGRFMGHGIVKSVGFLALAATGFAQDSGTAAGVPSQSSAAGTVTVAQKWRFFVGETFSPLTLVSGAANAAMSQATNSDPRYGLNGRALAERFGASVLNTASQDFLCDFAMASLFHQDTRYVRRGPAYGGVWRRFGFAVSRAFVTRTDTGGRAFNWSNLTGTALSSELSNVYYPPGSRNSASVALRFGTGVVGAGLANLFPEFWPDFRLVLRRHHLFPQ